MQEKVKYILRKGRVICAFAFITISSMPCKAISIDDIDVFVMNPKLLLNVSEIDVDNNKIEVIVSKNTAGELVNKLTPTPTVAPITTLIPEQEELKKYENYFKLYSFSYIEDNHDHYIAYFKANPNMAAIDVITYVNANLDYNFYANAKVIEIPDSPLVLVNKYNQLPSGYVPSDLKKVGSSDYLMRDMASTAFEEMNKAAKKEGISIFPVSAYRSFDYQNTVYWKKIPGGYKGINNLSQTQMKTYQEDRDKVSARAGFSEHQTGLAVDINSLEESFENTKEGKWLATNAYKYGYILRYPKGKENITGYNYEPWHFRYVGKSMANAIYNSSLTYDEFYARYIKPVFIKHPEAARLVGDEFYNKYLAPLFVIGQACMDRGLVNDINDSLASIGNYKVVFNDRYLKKENEEVLVLSNTK